MPGSSRLCDELSLANISVVVTDVDATITDQARRIDLDCIEIIRRLRLAGIPTVLASGNAYPVILYLAKFIGTEAPVVAENGGVVAWEKKGIKRVLGSRERPMKFIEELKGEYELRPIKSDVWRESEVVVERNIDFYRLSESALAFGLTVEDTKFAYHISLPHVRKFTGVKEALKLLGIEPVNALAIGDSQNDVEMIRECGVGAAVANSTDEAKAAADITSERPFGRGFVEMIGHYFPRL